MKVKHVLNIYVSNAGIYLVMKGMFSEVRTIIVKCANVN